METKLIYLFAVLTAGMLLFGCTQPSNAGGETPSSAMPIPGYEGKVNETEVAQNPDLNGPPSQPEGQNADSQPKTYTIEMTDSGYSPNNITIKAGDTVVFLNKGTLPNWPATAKHPTHEVYPEPGGCISSAFDACKGVLPGENFTFTFNQKGSWGYHEHLRFKTFGKINVE